jgi:hypothetical protein
MSVLSGIVTKRIKLTLSSLLKIHSDLVLGLFSFVIWALVTYQQTGTIHLNSDSELSLIRVVLLLFANIFLLITGLIILNVPWDEHRLPLFAWGQRNLENAANGLFLAVTVLFVFAPVMLKASTRRMQPAPTRYTVSISYLDASLASHVGLGRWGARHLCEVSDVAAPDRDGAIEKALTEFRSSGRSTQAFAKNTPATGVEIDTKRIVVEAVK